MNRFAVKTNCKLRTLKERFRKALKENREVSGITVIELVLILVKILTTYYGVSIRCIG